ncbi:MAG: FG-GAP repeat protein, partial [Myxococcota bacterium]
VGEEGADVGIGYLYDFEDPADPLHVFEAPDPAFRERLGWAVALGESFAALSAPGGDGSIEIGSLDGRVLIFDLESGELHSELQLETPDDGDYFGGAIDADGSTVVVGAPLADGERGAVYLFSVPAPESGALLASLTGLATLALRARSRSRPS